ncbi:MAG: 3-deoxy-7-phosphoheptulonate synthase [Thermoleophilia bacterium]|nr:3-deoxy-7-phosphoheptulonate synthase [Thermoleophilia bacterium]
MPAQRHTRQPVAANHPYRLAARGDRLDTVIHIGDARLPVGGHHVTMMAGPCAVENRTSLLDVAEALSGMGVGLLRGGAFKPRTSPYSFQGLGIAGLELLAEARERTGMAIVTEVLAIEDIDLVARHADVLQVGTRNMANYRLLDALGQAGRPVLLKRGQGSTVEELLCAAEYVLAAGNPDVMLCERGVRSFEPLVRNAFDLNVVPLLRELTHLPVIVDPSHAAGRADLVHAVAVGAVAAGAHGIIVEVHARPETALIDGEQSLDLEAAGQLVESLDVIARATGRAFARSAGRVAA